MTNSKFIPDQTITISDQRVAVEKMAEALRRSVDFLSRCEHVGSDGIPTFEGILYSECCDALEEAEKSGL